VNKQSALEWLQHAYHDLQGSSTLYDAQHYTDTISFVLQQSIEKTLKSILAYHNMKIKKNHNLIEIYELSLSDKLQLDDNDIEIIALATTYYTKQRYPSPQQRNVPRQEIAKVLSFANELFERVCKQLNISIEEIKTK